MTPAADALAELYGSLVVVRAPCPVLFSKGSANFKSEIRHREYTPRGAYDEWLAILDAVVEASGDAICRLEAGDEPYLDRGELEVDGDGWIHPAGSAERLGHVDDAQTGRVFTANGPWVVRRGGVLRALLPRLVPHRAAEAPYYRALLEELAALSGLRLELAESQHPWEGMADVTGVGGRAILTYTVRGHFDAEAPRPLRSSREGVQFAADFAGVPEAARVYAELVYPHYHGDTVHFCARPPEREPVLVGYAGGLWGDGRARVEAALGATVPIERADAVDHLAANCRQIGRTVLIPDGASEAFERSLAALGLAARRLSLRELLGKGGGGPACATLHLPAGLALPAAAPLRYSASRAAIRAHRERVPARLTVAAEYYERRAASAASAASAARATTRPTAPRPLSARIVRDPAALPAAEGARLAHAFSELTWRATRGGDQRFDDLLPFWRDYYATPGQRPTDYDLLAILEDGERIVAVVAVDVVESEVGHLFWLHLAYTDPAHQGRGALRELLGAVRPVTAELPGPLYAVCRTLNPTVYDLMRSFAHAFPAGPASFQPEVDEAGELRPVSEETRRLAARVAQVISPDREYDPAHFVIRAFFSELREVIGLRYPPSRSDAVNQYFQRHCDYARGDGALIFFRVH